MFNIIHMIFNIICLYIGPESHNVLGALKSEPHQWHGYREPVNVLANLPTCIGLGCGETINAVGVRMRRAGSA
jgi:hypothetical protein